ncbi:MAG: hypothetical protein Ct9H300mP1_22390 [Planctomycetaceae bacterium]|nr:MAG: hypothetical protein Ct9H300mP1_22390 [Planctomycetaceae bacterium]
MEFWHPGLRGGERNERRPRRWWRGLTKTESVPSRKFFWFSIGSLGFLFVAFLAGQSVLPVLKELGMGFVACRLPASF